MSPYTQHAKTAHRIKSNVPANLDLTRKESLALRKPIAPCSRRRLITSITSFRLVASALLAILALPALPSPRASIGTLTLFRSADYLPPLNLQSGRTGGPDVAAPANISADQTPDSIEVIAGTMNHNPPTMFIRRDATPGRERAAFEPPWIRSLRDSSAESRLQSRPRVSGASLGIGIYLAQILVTESPFSPSARAGAICPECRLLIESRSLSHVARKLRGHLWMAHRQSIAIDVALALSANLCECGGIATVKLSYQSGRICTGCAAKQEYLASQRYSDSDYGRPMREEALRDDDNPGHCLDVYPFPSVLDGLS